MAVVGAIKIQHMYQNTPSSMEKTTQLCSEAAFKQAVRISVSLWCHNHTVTALIYTPGTVAGAETNAETLQELPAQACDSWSIRAGLFFGKVVLKRQEHSDRGWIAVLQQWLLFSERSYFNI